jgi:hypothetical protein
VLVLNPRLYRGAQHTKGEGSDKIRPLNNTIVSVRIACVKPDDRAIAC